MIKNALITGKTQEPSVQHIFQKLQKELQILNIDSFIAEQCDIIQQDFDIVFSIGGDGSFVSAARKYVHYNKPIVAIKGGTIGFLSNIAPQNLSYELPKILSSDYTWTKRMLITGSTNNSPRINALNEFLFSSEKRGSLCHFTICINGDPVMKIRADGILISTPTGSTAYNLAAGGPLSLPDMKLLTITTVCSHVLGERPLTIELHHKVQIINDSPHNAKIWSDGQESIDLKPNDVFTVHDPLYIDSLHTSTKEFFNNLSLKLGWQRVLENINTGK